jgi:hypothetical protein
MCVLFSVQLMVARSRRGLFSQQKKNWANNLFLLFTCYSKQVCTPYLGEKELGSALQDCQIVLENGPFFACAISLKTAPEPGQQYLYFREHHQPILADFSAVSLSIIPSSSSRQFDCCIIWLKYLTKKLKNDVQYRSVQSGGLIFYLFTI